MPDPRRAFAALFLFASVPAFAGGSPAKRAEHHLKAGQAAFDKGDFAKAAKHFQACLKAQPDNEACKGGRTLAESRVPPAPAPRAAHPQAHAPAPKAAPHSAAPAGSKRDAIKAWNDGILLFQQGRYDEAHASWQKCLQLDPSNKDCETGAKRAEQAKGARR